MLAAEPYTLHVDGLSQIPDFLWCVDSIIVVGVHYTGVVEDDVQTAPGVDVCYYGFDVGFLGDIADLSLDLEIFCALDYFMELGNCSFKSWARDIREEDIGALTREED